MRLALTDDSFFSVDNAEEVGNPTWTYVIGRPEFGAKLLESLLNKTMVFEWQKGFSDGSHTTWIEAKYILDVIGIFLFNAIGQRHALHYEEWHYTGNLTSYFINTATRERTRDSGIYCLAEDEVAAPCLTCSNILNLLSPSRFARATVFTRKKINLHNDFP
jgi:hypothetical protein